jgi:ketosteroid isomerase-like protein
MNTANSGCAREKEEAAMAKAHDEMREAYAAWDAAFAKGDAKALAALYVDDAVFLPANHEIIKGPGGVRNSSQASSAWASPTISFR